MNNRPLSRELTEKYIRFLITQSDNLLRDGIAEYEFENLMREYAKFLYRLLEDTTIDIALKDDIVALDLFDANDLKNHVGPVVEGMLSELPFYHQLLKLNEKLKLQKVRQLKEGMSLLLFKIDGYSFGG